MWIVIGAVVLLTILIIVLTSDNGGVDNAPNFPPLPEAQFYYSTDNSIQQVSVDGTISPVLFPAAVDGIWALQSRDQYFYVSDSAGMRAYLKSGTTQTTLAEECFRFPEGSSTDFTINASTVYAIYDSQIVTFAHPELDCGFDRPPTTPILSNQITSPFSVEYFREGASEFLFVSGNGPSGTGLYRITLLANPGISLVQTLTTQGGISLTPSGNLYVTDPGSDCIYFVRSSDLSAPSLSPAAQICDMAFEDQDGDPFRGPISVSVINNSGYVSINDGTNIPGRIVILENAETVPVVANTPTFIDDLEGNRILIAN